jgi:hypothetical protein
MTTVESVDEVTTHFHEGPGNKKRPSEEGRKTFTLFTTGGQSRDRSDDLTLFRRALYRLSYLTRITCERPTLAGGTTTLRT